MPQAVCGVFYHNFPMISTPLFQAFTKPSQKRKREGHLNAASLIVC
jgi:hypothetical protein